jgi:murein DD-endopeptidase MepM/ murein hydrolase activator NlpD
MGHRDRFSVPNGFQLYYVHLMGFPPPGQKSKKVSNGQLIGFVGTRGMEKKERIAKFAANLHFGIEM